HVEHGHEVNAPWLRLGRSLLDQDRDTAVDRHGDLGVAARAEDGAGTCVGVEESNIGSGEYEAAVIFLQLLRVHQQEGEQGLQDRSLWSCERQEAEPEAPVAHSRKDVLTILEVIERHERVPIHQTVEEELRRVVRCYTG